MDNVFTIKLDSNKVNNKEQKENNKEKITKNKESIARLLY
jgi:hypothetical protein